MIQSISLYLVNILSSSNSFSEIDKEKMVYSLSALLSDFSKLVILLIFFTVMNKGKIFLIMFVFST
ncbi:MAG: accessory gene regulator B family protein, partial [Bacillota bacterium]|nr:accessory gene regulator B family protein [Bacillota bacterium]